MSEGGAPSGLARLKEAAALGSRFWRGFGHKGPRGPDDGPPAMVIPGFIANDRTTTELRRALAEAGFRVHPWRHGINWGANANTLEADVFGLLCATDDKREGMAAFLEKRAPKFTGR